MVENQTRDWKIINSCVNIIYGEASSKLVPTRYQPLKTDISEEVKIELYLTTEQYIIKCTMRDYK